MKRSNDARVLMIKYHWQMYHPFLSNDLRLLLYIPFAIAPFPVAMVCLIKRYND